MPSDSTARRDNDINILRTGDKSSVRIWYIQKANKGIGLNWLVGCGIKSYVGGWMAGNFSKNYFGKCMVGDFRFGMGSGRALKPKLYSMSHNVYFATLNTEL